MRARGKKTRSKSDGSQAPILALTGSLTVASAEQTRETLIAALRDQPSVVVDCSGADEIDLTFIQCLIAASRTAARAGKSFALAAPADGALKDILVRSGLLDPSHPTSSFWTSGVSAS